VDWRPGRESGNHDTGSVAGEDIGRGYHVDAGVNLSGDGKKVPKKGGEREKRKRKEFANQRDYK
jgi:hypothetical protein